MTELKDSLKELIGQIEELIAEVQSTDEIDNEKEYLRSDVIMSLDDSISSIEDAVKIL